MAKDHTADLATKWGECIVRTRGGGASEAASA